MRLELSRFYLGRRSLCLSFIFRLNLCGCVFFLYCFPAQRAQLEAVAEQLVNQGTLRIDGSALFHDQQGHKSIRDQEKQDENRKHRVLWLLCHSINREIQQLTPRSCAASAAMRCSLYANGANLCKTFQKRNLGRVSRIWPRVDSATPCTLYVTVMGYLRVRSATQPWTGVSARMKMQGPGAGRRGNHFHPWPDEVVNQTLFWGSWPVAASDQNRIEVIVPPSEIYQ